VVSPTDGIVRCLNKTYGLAHPLRRLAVDLARLLWQRAPEKREVLPVELRVVGEHNVEGPGGGVLTVVLEGVERLGLNCSTP
jgi:hypothetical protein